jgi:general secretion pathway protein D
VRPNHNYIMPPLRILGLCLALAGGLSAAGGQASKLYKQAQKAERAGELVRAYLLYAEAAALDPDKPVYWARSQALRTRAALQARTLPKPQAPPAAPPEQLPPVPSSLSQDDLADLRRLKPPPELKALPGRQTLDLKGDAKSLFQQAARAFGLDCVFDGDYQAGPSLRLRIQDAEYSEALHQLEAATGSFVAPLGERLLMVAKDTPQKRAEIEPTIAVMIPIPDPVTLQEAQEMARTVQQTMEILKLAVDSERRMVFIKDRISKVRPAQLLFEQLSRSRPQVAVELEMLEVDRSSFLSYGLMTPTQFPLAYLGNVLHSLPSLSSEFSRLLVFGGGRTLLGFGLADAEVFATMSRSSGHSLMRAEVRALDGSAASFHVGDKYPILSGGYFSGAQTGFLMPPAFTFEDLGLVLKITPHVHGLEEVSLELEAEFKVLAGQSLNGIPVISNRKLQSKVRLRNGQWGVVAGLMKVSEARNISGLAGLSGLPLLGLLFSQNTHTRDSTEVVLLLKPSLLSLPPDQAPTPPLYLGSEGRPQIPL